MAQAQMVDLIKRGAVLILYVFGTVLTAYHITAFKGDKYGLYFRDDDQLWLAIGVGLIAAGWAIRNWKKF